MKILINRSQESAKKFMGPHCNTLNRMLLMRICGLDSIESIVGRFGTSFLYPASWSWVEAALFCGTSVNTF
jgi:hypothetical protein